MRFPSLSRSGYNDQNGIGDGSITGKSDLGVYTYGADGAGPHAVSSINTTSGAQYGCTLASCKLDGIFNPKFYYDADGNMLCVTTHAGCSISAARSYGYTSFDMVESLAAGSSTTSLAYTPGHMRGSLTSSGVTLYYLSNPAAGVMNELVAGTWHTYIAAYGHIVAEFWIGGTPGTAYFTGDHLSSTTALTDANGNVTEYDSYDAWGKRRNADGSDASACVSPHPTGAGHSLRGYTGQEMLDSFCLVNLNARIYDPMLGRTLSADPTVPNGLNGQAFNRYSYVLNNPLSLTDPSGYAGCEGGTDTCPVIQCEDGGCPTTTGSGSYNSYPCWGCGDVHRAGVVAAPVMTTVLRFRK